MEQDWSTVVFDLLPYKDTGTYTLKWPDETLQLLDDHLVTIQNMSLSPYKKPFEGHINAWERKLRMAQVHTRTHAHTHDGYVKWLVLHHAIVSVFHILLLSSSGSYRMRLKNGWCASMVG